MCQASIFFFFIIFFFFPIFSDILFSSFSCGLIPSLYIYSLLSLFFCIYINLFVHTWGDCSSSSSSNSSSSSSSNRYVSNYVGR